MKRLRLNNLVKYAWRYGLLGLLPVTAWVTAVAGLSQLWWLFPALFATFWFVRSDNRAVSSYHLWRGSPEKALYRLEKEFSRHQDWLSAETLALVFLNMGKAKEALSWAEKAIELRPDKSQSFFSAGCALLQLERPRKAAEILNTGVRLSPKPEGRLALALAYARLNHGSLASDQLRMIGKKMRAGRLLVEAEMAFARGDQESAARIAMKAEKGLKGAPFLLLSRIGKQRRSPKFLKDNLIKGLKPSPGYRWLFGPSDEGLRLFLNRLAAAE